MRIWIPILITILLIVVLLSPLFNLHEIHGVASPKLYMQHFFFDFIAGLGGYWSSSFCKHWHHKVTLFLLIDVVSTLALVTLVG